MATKLQRQHPDSRQAQARQLAIWFDQHRDSAYRAPNGDRLFEFGRPWWSVIEKASGMPTGPVYPMGWEAPWLPPAQYVNDSIGRIAKQELSGTLQPRSVNSDRFRIAYERMVTDDRAAAQDHYQFAVTVARNNNLPIPKWGELMDPRVLVIAGVQPRSPKIAEAAMAGNKWLLGQLMPTLNTLNGKMEVEEDEQLARILKMHSGEFETPEQAERKHEVEAQAESSVKELLAEMMEMKRQLKAMEAERAAKPKGGRPPKKVEV